jgi:hypothetical protein
MNREGEQLSKKNLKSQEKTRKKKRISKTVCVYARQGAQTKLASVNVSTGEPPTL